MFQDDGTGGKTKKFHEHEFIVSLYLVSDEFFVLGGLVIISVMWKNTTTNKHFVSPQIMVLREALWAGKVNPYPEEMSIPERTKICKDCKVVKIETFLMEVVLCNQSDTSCLADHLGNGAISGSQN